jgi:hypothetical protein
MRKVGDGKGGEVRSRVHNVDDFQNMGSKQILMHLDY